MSDAHIVRAQYRSLPSNRPFIRSKRVAGTPNDVAYLLPADGPFEFRLTLGNEFLNSDKSFLTFRVSEQNGLGTAAVPDLSAHSFIDTVSLIDRHGVELTHQEDVSVFHSLQPRVSSHGLDLLAGFPSLVVGDGTFSQLSIGPYADDIHDGVDYAIPLRDLSGVFQVGSVLPPHLLENATLRITLHPFSRSVRESTLSGTSTGLDLTFQEANLPEFTVSNMCLDIHTFLYAPEYTRSIDELYREGKLTYSFLSYTASEYTSANTPRPSESGTVILYPKQSFTRAYLTYVKHSLDPILNKTRLVYWSAFSRPAFGTRSTETCQWPYSRVRARHGDTQSPTITSVKEALLGYFRAHGISELESTQFNNWPSLQTFCIEHSRGDSGGTTINGTFPLKIELEIVPTNAVGYIFTPESLTRRLQVFTVHERRVTCSPLSNIVEI